jgi:hypothetical protein
VFEQVGSREIGLTPTAAEGYEVGLLGFLETFETAWHEKNTTPLSFPIAVMRPG